MKVLLDRVEALQKAMAVCNIPPNSYCFRVLKEIKEIVQKEIKDYEHKDESSDACKTCND